MNYTFTGWTGSADINTSTDVTISKGSADDRSYTATWTANTYTVKYETNGGTGSMGNQTFTYDAEQALSDNKFTRTGYTFNGWKDNASNKTYKGGETVKNLASEQGAVVTLYAQWTVNQYTITFNSNGGNNISPITQDYGTAVATPADPIKTGYTFNGWDKEIPSTMPAENLTFTANWKINQYTLTFNTDGGSEISAITQDYNTAVVAPANPTKTGYTFEGWDKEIPSTMPAENLTFTANWKVSAVSEDINSGDIDSENKTSDLTEKDKKVQEILENASGDLSAEQVNAIVENLAAGTSNLNLTSEQSNAIINGILSNSDGLSSTLLNDTAQAQTLVQNLGIVDKDSGKIDTEVMKTLTNELTTETGEMTADKLNAPNSTAGKMVVAALTSSVANANNTSGELKLESVPLTSLNGISTLLDTVANGSGKTTSDLTLDLGGMETLTKIDNLDGVDINAMKLENTLVTDVDLSKATKIGTVSMSNSQVKQLTLGKDSNVTEINANGSKNLVSVDIEGNPYIETLDISGTNVSSLNAEDCANLKQLAVAGNEESGGSLENVNLEGCENLEELTVSNNKLLGIKKPSTMKNPNITFRARGQKRSSNDFKLSQGMNLWEFLWDVWQSTLEDDDANKGAYTLESRDIAPFDVANITSVNGVSPDADGNVEFSSVPVSFTYEYDPGFNTVGMSSLMAADNDPESGMDVTIGSSSDDDAAVSSSGGGCELIRNEGLGMRNVLILILFLLGFSMLKIKN